MAFSKPARAFDLRWLIALVLGFYGLILLCADWFNSPAALAKAEGIPINLWIGAGLLVLALFFVLWSWRSPLRVADRAGGDETSEPPRV